MKNQTNQLKPNGASRIIAKTMDVSAIDTPVTDVFAMDKTALAVRNSGAQTPFKFTTRPAVVGEVRLTKADKAAHREAKQQGTRACVHADRNFQMLGWVHKGYFYVDDTQSGGYTHRELTGSRPNYKPILLSKIEGLGHRIEYI